MAAKECVPKRPLSRTHEFVCCDCSAVIGNNTKTCTRKSVPERPEILICTWPCRIRIKKCDRSTAEPVTQAIDVFDQCANIQGGTGQEIRSDHEHRTPPPNFSPLNSVQFFHPLTLDATQSANIFRGDGKLLSKFAHGSRPVQSDIAERRIIPESRGQGQTGGERPATQVQDNQGIIGCAIFEKLRKCFNEFLQMTFLNLVCIEKRPI